MKTPLPRGHHIAALSLFVGLFPTLGCGTGKSADDGESDGTGGTDANNTGGSSAGGGHDGTGGNGEGGQGHRSCDGSAPPALSLTEIAKNIGNAPVYVTSDPNDASRLFVVDLYGSINIVQGGIITEAGKISVENGNGEQGLHSMAFHPLFGGSETRIYLAYSQPGGDTRIAELTIDGDTIDTSNIEDKIIFEQEQPAVNHNGGQLQFGPDGYLYFGLGDGGGGCNTFGFAEDLTVPLASIIRLDVDDLEHFPEGNLPTDTGSDGRIFHHGLRNPWRFSFDRGTNDLYIADVGQDKWEEINILPAGSGTTDFGWPVREGTHSSADSNCSDGGNRLPEHFDPIFDYPHSDGKSVTGGYVYRGSAIPGLQGRYLFADYNSNRVWNLTWDGSKMCDFSEISEELDPDGVLNGITSFGEDAAGEIYVAVAGMNGNAVYRIDAE